MTTIAQLRQNLKLWHNLLVLFYDLQNYEKDHTARKRLDSIVDLTYIDLTFFKTHEAQLLKETLVDSNLIPKDSWADEEFDPQYTETDTKTKEIGSSIIAMIDTFQNVVEASLAHLGRKRAASGDYRPCTAHDLAPLFMTLLDVRKEELKDEKFLARRSRLGPLLKVSSSEGGQASALKGSGKEVGRGENAKKKGKK